MGALHPNPHSSTGGREVPKEAFLVLPLSRMPPFQACLVLCFCTLPLTKSFLPPSPPSSQDDPVTNLNNAFEVAEKYLDIPKMLDAEGKYIPFVQSPPCSAGMCCGNFKELAVPVRRAG